MITEYVDVTLTASRRGGGGGPHSPHCSNSRSNGENLINFTILRNKTSSTHCVPMFTSAFLMQSPLLRKILQSDDRWNTGRVNRLNSHVPEE